MKKSILSNSVIILGTLSVLIGAVHVFVPNDSPYHDPLQIVLALGLLLIGGTIMWNKRSLKANQRSGESTGE